MLELDEGQLSRPVLRGRGGSNTSLLPGRSVDGSSQRGGSARPDPAGLARSVGRGEGMVAARRDSRFSAVSPRRNHLLPLVLGQASRPPARLSLNELIVFLKCLRS